VSEVIQPAVAGLVPGAAPPVVDVGDVQLRVDARLKLRPRVLPRCSRAMDSKRKASPWKATLIRPSATTPGGWGADVMVGTHDRSRVERLVLGSVSESVVKHAPCSVLGGQASRPIAAGCEDLSGQTPGNRSP
jgi:hypothetical protein